ncbi:hypothetical protein [Sinorhizobium fredii]|uniref:hypothetical protein n=1 Tax=Rhizobium fredii TaxID=380 RepID=UPI00339B3E13
MHLEHDLEIRRAVRSVLPEDVALGVGDGWHHIVARALKDIRDIADEAGIQVEITHVERKRASLVIRTDALGRRVPMDVADPINEIRFYASDRSSMTCERCGRLGFVIAGDEPRVRCGRCEASEVARQAIQQDYRDHIAGECRHYISFCLKAKRLFPVENIVIQVAPTETEQHFLVDEVHERLVWWRAGSWIEGVDERMRVHFRKLGFGQQCRGRGRNGRLADSTA